MEYEHGGGRRLIQPVPLPVAAVLVLTSLLLLPAALWAAHSPAPGAALALAALVSAAYHAHPRTWLRALDWTTASIAAVWTVTLAWQAMDWPDRVILALLVQGGLGLLAAGERTHAAWHAWVCVGQVWAWRVVG